MSHQHGVLTKFIAYFWLIILFITWSTSLIGVDAIRVQGRLGIEKEVLNTVKINLPLLFLVKVSVRLPIGRLKSFDLDKIESLLNPPATDKRSLTTPASHPSELTNSEKSKWALLEIRRLTYKLGKYHRRIREISNERSRTYSTFDFDRNELLELGKLKAEVYRKLEDIKGLRRAFIRFVKGLKCNAKPLEPWVPLKYRSQQVPSIYYRLGKRKVPGLVQRVDRAKSLGKSNSEAQPQITKEQPKITEDSPRDDIRHLLSILEAKGAANPARARGRRRIPRGF